MELYYFKSLHKKISIYKERRIEGKVFIYSIKYSFSIIEPYNILFFY